jgi:SpoVK/Ycf46/Vps4 family AAA+-type ATPase
MPEARRCLFFKSSLCSADSLSLKSSSDLEKRIVATLLTLMDGAASKTRGTVHDNVFVLAGEYHHIFV